MGPHKNEYKAKKKIDFYFSRNCNFLINAHTTTRHYNHICVPISMRLLMYKHLIFRLIPTPYACDSSTHVPHVLSLLPHSPHLLLFSRIPLFHPASLRCNNKTVTRHTSLFYTFTDLRFYEFTESIPLFPFCLHPKSTPPTQPHHHNSTNTTPYLTAPKSFSPFMPLPTSRTSPHACTFPSPPRPLTLHLLLPHAHTVLTSPCSPRLPLHTHSLHSFTTHFLPHTSHKSSSPLYLFTLR